jgi:Helix-turn-helix domain of resolvase
MASAFPTTWWYVNGQRVKCQPRLADSSFPMTSWNAINTGALRVYPAISIGASAHGGSPQTPDNKPGTRTAEGRSWAQKRGQHMGRPSKLTDAQKVEARRRRAQGATLAELARSYNVGKSTISRLMT